jgi:hypothetical protein
VVYQKYKESRTASEQASIRAAISLAALRKSGAKFLTLSQNEALVLRKIVNLAFKHFPDPIHPGRNGLARSTGLSLRTIIRALAFFRANGFIDPVLYAKGGCKSTRYTVNFTAIMNAVYGETTYRDGELLQIYAASKSVWNRAIQPENRANLAHGIKERSTWVEALNDASPDFDENEQPPGHDECFPSEADAEVVSLAGEFHEHHIRFIEAYVSQERTEAFLEVLMSVHSVDDAESYIDELTCNLSVGKPAGWDDAPSWCDEVEGI